MSYLSLYRKYRSQSFGELIGQDHVVKTLQSAIGSGKIAHAYLFTGPRGTGKTSTARLLAKALCCEKGPTAEPCNECDICLSITNGSSLDVYELDAASESTVDNVRETIVEAVEYQPSVCRFKIFIIDEVHDLSAKAFDALLKTIEEPPDHAVFILATTEYHKVPPTIRSRCQKYEFHRASIQDLMRSLEHVAKSEGAAAEPAALALIARMADGGYRDALTLLEQALIASDGTVTVQQVYDQLGLIADETSDGLLLAIRGSNVPNLIDLLNQVIRLGRDPRSVVESLLYRIADLTRASYGLESGDDSAREAALHATAAAIGREHLLALRTDLAEVHLAIRDITLPRIWLESKLIGLATSGARPAPSAAVPAYQAPVAANPSSTKAPTVAVVAEAVGPASAQPTPAESFAARPASVVDPTSEMGRVFQSLLGAIPTKDGKKSILSTRLEAFQPVSLDDTSLIVEGPAFHTTWFSEKRDRTDFLDKSLAAILGKPMKVVIRESKARPEAEGASAQRKNAAMFVETVEREKEGQELHSLAESEFGNRNS